MKEDPSVGWEEMLSSVVLPPVGLPGTEHGAQHAPVQLGVVGGALRVLPHPHVHLLQGGTHRAAEVDGAPAWDIL